MTGATQRGRSRLHHPERRDRSDSARSLAKSDPERRLAATPPGRSRSLERPLGATTGGRCAPSDCSNSFILKGLLVLEYHMEFFETFGCIWSSKEVIKVIIGRAVHGRDLTGATP
ncbi:hypothetical protein F2Q70_00035828 [Brassica cretica]|uniref:Uncharacterized protein n=1 Tax=Brassica cretica TaxID=69181 RepID=A0A8S9JWP6_BRACR|nr:hypothetical protein F2Q70_00035828 [Brassica cretica]